MPTRLFVYGTLVFGLAQSAVCGTPARAASSNEAEAAPGTGPAAAPADAALAQKSVRALVNAIRYNKDQVAQKHLNFDGMAKLLLQDSYTSATAAERRAFVSDLTTLVAATSFPKGRDLFGYLDALLFEAATASGDTLHVKSVVVVHRNLKKVELPIEWVLSRTGKDWQVVDIISMSESTAAGIREEEVLPLLHEGGLAKVLAALHERAATVAATKPTEAPAP